MTSTDSAAREIMRAYADSLQPPPVADVLARAEDFSGTAPPAPTAGLRSSRTLVILSLAAAGAAAVVGAVSLANNGHGDQGSTAEPGVTAAPRAGGMAPGCPPALPVVTGLAAADGTTAKVFAAAPGQRVTVLAELPDANPDRRLLSFRIDLLPVGADIHDGSQPVSESASLALAPGQQHVSPELRIPEGTAPGSYNLIGHATWPGPSLCGVPNPAGATQIGSSDGIVGSIIVR